TMEIAGPEPIRMDEIGRRFLSATQDSRKVTTDVHALYFGTELNDQSLVPAGKARLGSLHFAEWLNRATTQNTATEKRSAPASNLSGNAAKGVALFLCGIIFAALPLRDAAADGSTTDKSKVAATTEPKEAKLTQLFSKDLTDLPGKEGLMLLIEYPPGS